jgi:hypothetical protein
LGEITATTDPGQARQHLQRAVELAESADSRLVAGFAEVSLATWHARHGEPATALRYYQQVIELPSSSYVQLIGCLTDGGKFFPAGWPGVPG